MNYLEWRTQRGIKPVRRALEEIHLAMRWERHLLQKVGRLQDWVAKERELWTLYVKECAELGIQPEDNIRVDFSTIVVVLNAALFDDDGDLLLKNITSDTSRTGQ